MSYAATSRRGLGFTAGYQVVGGCDAAGNPTGGVATGATVQYPDGSLKCLQYSDPAWLNINYNRQPGDTSQVIPIIPPVPTPLGLPDAGGAILPPASTAGSGVASGSIVDSAVAWAKQNPWMAAAIAIGVVLVVGRL